MKPGLFGQKLTLMEELRAATSLSHARLQATPFFQALAACQLPLESHVGQLRALAAIHGVLKQAMEGCADARAASVWRPEMCKVSQLQQDLRYFEPRTVADIKEAVEAAPSRSSPPLPGANAAGSRSQEGSGLEQWCCISGNGGRPPVRDPNVALLARPMRTHTDRDADTFILWMVGPCCAPLCSV